jgi:hypothetical protein
MFGFRKTIKEPLADAKTAERWLASFPANDPLAMHGAVLVGLGRLAERDAKRTPGRLEAIFCVDRFTDSLRKTLTAQYLEHGNRSTRVEYQLWQALFDLTQGFLLCYQAFAREVTDRSATANGSRCCRLIAQQIKSGSGCRSGCFATSSGFRQVVGPAFAFQMACSADREGSRSRYYPMADDTIEQEYCGCWCCTSRATSTHRHLEWVAGQLWNGPRRCARPSVVDRDKFYVITPRAPTSSVAPQPLEGRVLFLDTRPLRGTDAKRGHARSESTQQPALRPQPRPLDQLNLSGVGSTRVQAFPAGRTNEHRGQRRAIIGFAKIAGFLRDEEMQPFIDGKRSPSTFGETIEIATFGRMRNENARAMEMARRRLANYAVPGGAWDVRDVSQTGFRLIAPMSVINAVTLGTLAAIRPQTQLRWTLGIVRRMAAHHRARRNRSQVIANNLVEIRHETKRTGRFSTKSECRR